MMHWLVGWSLKSRRLVIVATVVMMTMGVWHLKDASLDALPEFIPPTVEVQTEALGLSAEEVEQLITVPLEQDLLNGVAWLDVIRSKSVPGLSSIELIFERGTDVIKARQVVQERMTQAHALPQVSKPPQMLQPLSSTSRVMMVKLSSEKLTPIELAVLARWTIRPRLMGAKGVANVAIWGQRERQLQVQVDPARLQAKGISLEQIIATAGNALWVSPLTFLEASTPGTGGFIDTPNQRLGVQHLSPIKTAEDLAQVPVEESGGALRLGDVADVVEDHQPLIGDAIFADGEGLMLVIEKFPGADTTAVTDEIDKAFDALRPGMQGVEIDSSIFRPARLVDTAADNIRWAVLVAGLVLAFLLGILFFDWRKALISTVSIGAAIIAAAVVLDLRGTTFHAMVLAGLVLALVIIVDDAVTDTENITRRLTEERDRGNTESTASIVHRASLETRSLAGYGTTIILVSLVPVLVMKGLSTDSFFPPVAMSYALAVLASFLVTLTFTPAVTAELYANAERRDRSSPVLRGVAKGYDGVAGGLLRRPLPMLGVGALVAIAGLGVFPALDKHMLPTFKDTDLLIAWDGSPGTSLPEMARITQLAAKELRGIPGVENVGAHVGRAVMADQVVGIDSGEIWLRMKSGANYGKTVERIRSVVSGYPGLRSDVLTYPQQRIRKVLTGASEPIVVRIFGQELDVLRAKAAEVQRLLAGIDGVTDAKAELQIEEPTMKIEVDLAAAQRFDLRPGDVRRAAATLISGIEVGSLFEDQKVFEVVVRGIPAVRESLTSVRQLLVDTPSGKQVPLDEVADVRIAPTPNIIRHEAVRRSIDITANVDGRSVAAVKKDLTEGLAQVKFPTEHHAEVIGDYQELQVARRRLIDVTAAAMIAVFLLLQVAFSSWRLAFIVSLTTAVGMVGGLVIAAIASGQSLSFGSAVGFLALLGLGARNGLFLVGRYQQLAAIDPDASVADRVLRGTRERLGPIVVTAVSSAGAFLVLAVFGPRIGQEIIQPMAIVILGGLVTSTLINLLVLPSIYTRFAAPRERSVVLPRPDPTPVTA